MIHCVLWYTLSIFLLIHAFIWVSYFSLRAQVKVYSIYLIKIKSGQPVEVDASNPSAHWAEGYLSSRLDWSVGYSELHREFLCTRTRKTKTNE